jgi:hypothetical protein
MLAHADMGARENRLRIAIMRVCLEWRDLFSEVGAIMAVAIEARIAQVALWLPIFVHRSRQD